ncbi:hypothetical protein [Prevotella communis]|uniref:hypothetical protein n=1 Tax=Prevotella communis TaxID=2913614 RepID=UPI001ED9E2EA|nr:hypothetical protein [Prevotella communis]UKK56913.1 hypothetical protein L6476_01235 [Prevotella communis]
MFIHLDNSLLVEETDPIYDNVLRAVRNLALAAFESKHILYGDYDVIVAMREHFRYDRDLWNVFNKIYQMYSQMGCPMEISYYLKVTKEGGDEGMDEEGKRYGQIAYSAFEDTKSMQECNLISEDFNDCEFYRLVLDYYKKRNNIKIPCKFCNVSGAGDRTIENVRNCVHTNKQVSICIVDTDKKYPTQSLNKKKPCYQCQKIGTNIPTYYFVMLEVQEIENLVPFNVTDELEWYDENHDNKVSFDSLRHNAKSEYVLPYFDIKNGIVNDDLLRTDAKYRDFVKVCYYLHPKLSLNTDFNSYIATLKDKEVLFPHLLKGLLKVYLEFVKATPLFTIELLDYQQMEWNKIGKAMLNMGCARNKESIT